MDGVLRLLLRAEMRLATLFAVRDEQAGALVAAVGDDRGAAAGPVDTGLRKGSAVVAAAGQCEGVTKIEMADVFAAGCRGRRLYAYRVRGLGRSAVVLWIGGENDEPDRVLTLPEVDHCRVPVFTTVRQARLYVSRQGRRLACSEADILELDRVEHWLENPARRRVPSGSVLDAWNFFEDLARGLGEVHWLPPQSTVHDGAYEKLVGGECAAWTPEEQGAVLELITAGAELWNSCPVIGKPCSRTVFGGGRRSPGGR